MNEPDNHTLFARRAFLQRTASITGFAVLTSLLGRGNAAMAAHAPHFAAKAKRVIYLHQSGGPSHIDLFDPKPKLREMHGKDLPDSVRRGQRLTGMTSGQKTFPMIASKFAFNPGGRCGTMLSELLPHLDRRSRACVATFATLYEGILDAIEAADYDVFTVRPSVPTVRKLAIVAGGLGRGLVPL